MVGNGLRNLACHVQPQYKRDISAQACRTALCDNILHRPLPACKLDLCHTQAHAVLARSPIRYHPRSVRAGLYRTVQENINPSAPREGMDMISSALEINLKMRQSSAGRHDVRFASSGSTQLSRPHLGYAGGGFKGCAARPWREHFSIIVLIQDIPFYMKLHAPRKVAEKGENSGAL